MDNILKNKDCLLFMRELQSSSVELAILDPPYNVNAAKWDNIENYFDWMKKILIETERVLTPNGSLYLWGMSKNNDFLKLKLFLDENSTLSFKNWIVWLHECKLHRKLKDRYLTKHEDLLFYAGEKSTFNMVRDDPPPFQLKMHKGKYDENFFVERASLPPSQQKIFKNGLQMGSPAKSWWKGLSNQSASKKYNNFMGYKSEWVCDRIVSVSSNVGDTILIPFAGYGTECVSCIKLERHFIASELNKEHFNIAMKRISEVKFDQIKSNQIN